MVRSLTPYNLTLAADAIDTYYHIHPDLYSVYQHKVTGQLVTQIPVLASSMNAAYGILTHLLEDYTTATDPMCCTDYRRRNKHETE